eukprot:evm.model.scf_155.10 EVM.evm.TU.scf_155.10   scf_155:123063-125253(+)
MSRATTGDTRYFQESLVPGGSSVHGIGSWESLGEPTLSRQSTVTFVDNGVVQIEDDPAAGHEELPLVFPPGRTGGEHQEELPPEVGLHLASDARSTGRRRTKGGRRGVKPRGLEPASDPTLPTFDSHRIRAVTGADYHSGMPSVSGWPPRDVDEDSSGGTGDYAVGSLMPRVRTGILGFEDGSSNFSADALHRGAGGAFGEGPAGTTEALEPSLEFDRRPRPLEFAPYTQQDFWAMNYDSKRQKGYWQLGKLGPDLETQGLLEK